MDSNQFRRYSRHILLREIDEDGQQRLLNSHVLIIGLGGLGSSAALYLASSGVGKLTLCDYDTVDLSNLQRQIIHVTDNIGQKKVDSAQNQLRKLNPDVATHNISRHLAEDELGQLIVASAVDAVVDASDNFATRYLLNRTCSRTRTPLISGAAIRFEGQVTSFLYRDNSPCYQCLYPESESDDGDTCDQLGVLAPLTGVIGSLQAAETLKILAEFGEPLNGRLLTFDLLTMKIKTLSYQRDPACPICRGFGD